MGSRGRLQFTDTEQKYETGGRVDKEKITRRRQEKKSRGIIKETERGAGETGSRTTYDADNGRKGDISLTVDREKSSGSHTGGTSVERGRNQAVRENIGKPSGLRFEENREKPSSKLVHRTKLVAEDAAVNMYQRAKNLNRKDRETETSEKSTDTMEQGVDTVVQTGRRLRFQQEARKEARAFSDPGRTKLKETDNRRIFDSPTKRGSDGRRVRAGSRAKKKLSSSAREEMRLMYEIDRLKHPWAYDTKASAIQQKRALRKRYAAKVRARKRKERAAAAVTETARAAEKAAVKGTQMTIAFFVRHPILGFILFLIALIFILIFLGMGACSSCAGGVSSGVTATSYPTPDSEMLAAERIYVQMEEDLKFELDNYEDLHPNYDEYHFDLDTIGHDPYVLVTLLTARKKGEWTAEEMRPVMEEMFQKEYILTEDVTVETRTREVEKTDPVTGETVTEEEEYEYRIINVTLENRDLSRQTEDLTREMKGLYAAYISTHGNRPDLFDPSAYPNAAPRGTPERYEIPASALTDEQFALMISVAERYLGYPYVWGGSSPATSFDCSGFVCWVMNNSGWHVGRRTANGLMSIAFPIEPENAKPGDLIFFKNTYRTAGASHVGIYVGNGMMIHCGDPISYTSINTPYWQSHFLRFGRIQ